MLIRLLRDHLRSYRKTLLVIVCLQLVQVLATLYLPTLNADIIDKGIVRDDHGYILRTGALMLGITFVQVAFSVTAIYFGSRTAMGFGRDVRRNLFHRVTGYSAREVNQFGSPSLITRITNDVQQVQMLVVMGCTMLIAAPLTMAGGIFMALREDVRLSTMLIVSVPALGVTVGLVVSRMVPQFRRMQDRIDSVNRILREQIIGIRVVRAFVREPDEAERFGHANALLTDSSLRAGRLQAGMFPTVMFVLNTSMVAAVWIGGNRIASGDMQVGAMIAFLSYLTQILMSVMMGTFVMIMVPRAAVCADRIQEVLDTDTSVLPAERPVESVTERGLLEFRGVSFHYPGADEPVLRNVSFTARAGETTAIIGSTGAGKSTLLQLVPRLFDATQGGVLIDGADVRDLDPQIIWDRVGLVPQRPYLFSGTVATNLRFADADATEDELWQALEIAQAKDFVQAMGGLDARIEQGGTNVSGGQRQRLSIARALVHHPEIYLFDDSFSALDLATDARLRAALAPHTADSTVLIVGQRVSTIRNADRIIVLEDGEVVGLGRHEDLLESCPTYAEIVASQITQEEAVA